MENEEVKSDQSMILTTQREITALGFNLKLAVLSRLEDGRWLNDEIINFMLNLMVKSIPTEELRKKVILQTTFLFPMVLNQNYNDDDMLLRMKKQFLRNKEDNCYYIVPIN